MGDRNGVCEPADLGQAGAKRRSHGHKATMSFTMVSRKACLSGSYPLSLSLSPLDAALRTPPTVIAS
ncbi:hypothetical protein E2C01_006576 [Portunus trituberculatus]|uniref:Uncharacterized protein n=1 Tax=Portunus trituberculatus TaxID=210409 RepID=A0A5B7CX81_PORTR|nr:hypothetical protein [Portunus trituberculatus]